MKLKKLSIKLCIVIDKANMTSGSANLKNREADGSHIFYIHIHQSLTRLMGAILDNFKIDKYFYN